MALGLSSTFAICNNYLFKGGKTKISMFNHFDLNGNGVIVDISNKDITKRTASAVGFITMTQQCYNMIKEKAVKKGDVLSVARVAGIMATKQTSSIIPFCHNIPIEKVSIDFETFDKEGRVSVTCTVITTSKTGVEMEALTGVNVALLTIYDMCKAIDKSMLISDICLKEKSGGNSGHFIRSQTQ